MKLAATFHLGPALALPQPAPRETGHQHETRAAEHDAEPRFGGKSAPTTRTGTAAARQAAIRSRRTMHVQLPMGR